MNEQTAIVITIGPAGRELLVRIDGAHVDPAAIHVDDRYPGQTWYPIGNGAIDVRHETWEAQ